VTEMRFVSRCTFDHVMTVGDSALSRGVRVMLSKHSACWLSSGLSVQMCLCSLLSLFHSLSIIIR